MAIPVIEVLLNEGRKEKSPLHVAGALILPAANKDLV